MPSYEINITIQPSQRYAVSVHGSLSRQANGIYYRPNNLAHPLRAQYVNIRIEYWSQEYYHLTIEGVYHAVLTERGLGHLIFGGEVRWGF